MNYYLLIIPIAILVLLLWIIWKSLDSFENEINVDGHNGFESEFHDDNLGFKEQGHRQPRQ